MDRPWVDRRLHFVGIGGAGMSGLALVAQRARRVGDRLRPLRRLVVPHAAARGRDRARRRPRRRRTSPTGAEVVYSTAIGPDNPERAAAPRARAAPRPTCSASSRALKPTIAVSGTHGKTTTSSMIVHALRGTGADPAYLVGGELRSTGSNAGWGTGEWLVVEADESDRSLLKLDAARRGAHQRRARPPHDLRVAARRRGRVPRVPGAAEHAVRVGPAGAARAGGRPRVGPSTRTRRSRRRLALRARRRRGRARGAGRPQRAQRRRRAEGDPRSPAETSGRRRGRAARTSRAPAGASSASAARPTGARVVDDYAHHPTEVRATLAAARTLDPRRVVAVFQPHLYSRTQRQAREFGAALALRRPPGRPDIYPARERAEDFPGVTGRLVAEAAADARRRQARRLAADARRAAERFLAPTSCATATCC